MSPTFFLIFVNSLFELYFRGFWTAFADELSFVYKSESNLNVVASINFYLDLLRTLFAKHRIFINSKANIAYFNFKKTGIQYFIILCILFQTVCAFLFQNAHALTLFPLAYNALWLVKAVAVLKFRLYLLSISRHFIRLFYGSSW